MGVYYLPHFPDQNFHQISFISVSFDGAGGIIGIAFVSYPSDHIRDLDLNPDTVVAECDGRIISRDDYESLLLQEGSVLELIRFVGGG